MSSTLNHPTENEKTAIVNVAVAVIHHKEQYLLGFRSAAQHQGNRYEFVGGKIDADESAEQAIIREVAEETGIAVHDNIVVKLGRLHHDYGDKQVSLQVYKIELTTAQYDEYKYCEYGLEGQALTWVNKSDLLMGSYHLPSANQTILEWLKLPAKIAITYPMSHFHVHSDPVAAWLQYHQEKLAAESWVYIRVKEAESNSITAQLMRVRPDIHAIVPYEADNQSLAIEQSTVAKEISANDKVAAHHLTHTALIHWFDNVQDLFASDQGLSITHPLIVSCHDADSINAANKLASARIQQQLPPLIGVFLSPVLATQTHAGTAPLGWKTWSELAQLADMPVIGLGGLSPAMIDEVLEHGGISLAGIRQFF